VTVAAPTRQTLTAAGLEVAYRASGSAGSAFPPVLMLHGWGASLEAVQGIQSGLEGAFYVVALDLPGFGQSEPPPSVWGSPEYAALVREVVERLGLGRVHLIGHSFGGKVGIYLAARWPELVERLVLVNSAGIRPRRTARYYVKVGAYKAARRLARSTPLAEPLLARFGSTDYRQAGRMRPILVRVVNEDIRPLLPRVQAPTLLVWGERDDETPLAGGQLMERLMPDAGLVVFPGAGHYAYADDLPRFCRVVSNFLKG
jgi:pimeloyl-ACP methyl ester carboxylesterase